MLNIFKKQTIVCTVARQKHSKLGKVLLQLEENQITHKSYGQTSEEIEHTQRRRNTIRSWFGGRIERRIRP